MVRLRAVRPVLTRVAIGAALLLPAIFRDGPPVAARPRTCARRADVAACPVESTGLRAAPLRVRQLDAPLAAPFRPRRGNGSSASSPALPSFEQLTILPVLVREPGVTPELPEFLPGYRQTTLVPRPPPSA